MALAQRVIDQGVVEEHDGGAATVDVVGGGATGVEHHLGQFGHGGTAGVAFRAAIDHHKEQVVAANNADGGAGLLPLDGVVAEVGVYFNVFDTGKDCAVFDQGRAEGEGLQDAFCQEGLGVGAGFVVDFGGAVSVEGQAGESR